jgi:hypothetical protein
MTRVYFADDAVFRKEEMDSERVSARDYPFVIRVEYEIPANWISSEPLVIVTPTY